MNFIKILIDFFREDLSEILGVYYDGEKIFFARLTDKVEMDEINFEIADNDTPAIERLAEKIKLHCNKNGWQASKISLILREGAAVTFQTDFKNIPAAEIENAVKIWAAAHVEKDVRYTFINVSDEIWMEALPASSVEEYIDAFDKNSMQLCNLTEFPQILIDSERPPTPFNRAIFAADILKNKKPPNIIKEKISTWNIEKISLTAAAIFFIVLTGFSAKLASDYYYASTRAETAQNRFSSQSDINLLKQDFDAVTGQIKQFDATISTQDINSKNFNALIKIGKISDGKIILDKIKTTGKTLELEGATESPDAIKLYLNRLKNSVSPKVKLKNSSEIDGQIIFSLSISY